MHEKRKTTNKKKKNLEKLLGNLDLHFFSSDSQRNALKCEIEELNTLGCNAKLLKNLDKKISVNEINYKFKTLIDHVNQFVQHFHSRLRAKRPNLFRGQILKVGSVTENLRTDNEFCSVPIEIDYMLELGWIWCKDIIGISELHTLKVPTGSVILQCGRRRHFNPESFKKVFQDTARFCWRFFGDKTVIKEDFTTTTYGVKMVISIGMKKVEVDLVPCISIYNRCCKSVLYKKCHHYLEKEKYQKLIKMHLILLNSDFYRISTSHLEQELLTRHNDFYAVKSCLRVVKYCLHLVCPDMPCVPSYYIKNLALSVLLKCKTSDMHFTFSDYMRMFITVLSVCAKNILEQRKDDGQPHIYQNHFLLRCQVEVMKTNTSLLSGDVCKLVKLLDEVFYEIMFNKNLFSEYSSRDINNTELVGEIMKFHRANKSKEHFEKMKSVFIQYIVTKVYTAT